jgi:hypothetical protein
MKKEIWKYTIHPFTVKVRMPEGAEILTVQIQNGVPCIWVLVNPENELEIRNFEIFGTGQKIACDIGVERKYINTFQMENGSLVFHLFERLN